MESEISDSKGGEGMSLNETPSGNRIHIGFFGCRNAGKSSLVNKLTNQLVSVVSDVLGTTTDPVTKSMELLPLGPVVIIDTPGYDDEGNLGEKRISRTKQILNKTDIAVLVVDATADISEFDKELIKAFEDRNIPYIKVYNKCDAISVREEDKIYVSAETGEGVNELKNKIAGTLKKKEEIPIVSDMIENGDIILLVVPIDESAPKGRLILPQQQTIRDILDKGGISIAVKDTELPEAIEKFKDNIKLVITDSQVFKKVAEIIPDDMALTSFSILMARHKGFLEFAKEGVYAIDKLEDGDNVLIAEGCTHHRQCGDIGSVKIPAMLKKRTGKNLVIETSSGMGFPDDLSEYSLIIHCGGCMLSEREVLYRMKCAREAGVPVTNYGTAIAYVNGIFERSIKPLKEFC